MNIDNIQHMNKVLRKQIISLEDALTCAIVALERIKVMSNKIRSMETTTETHLETCGRIADKALEQVRGQVD